MLDTLLFAAETIAEHEEASKTPFYVAGLVLAAWAVVLTFIGMRQTEDWPKSEGTGRAIMGISTILVAAAMVTAVITG